MIRREKASKDQCDEEGSSEDCVDASKVPPGRSCEFCSTTQTPMWRRGPGGKASLCNACGVRWNVTKAEKTEKDKESTSEEEPEIIKTTAAERESGVFVRKNDEGNDEEFYYCKYCDNSWPSTHFRNRQQFGAHCSNCSRKRKVNPIDAEHAHKTPARTKMHKKSRRSYNQSNTTSTPTQTSEDEEMSDDVEGPANAKLMEILSPAELNSIRADEIAEKMSMEEEVKFMRTKLDKMLDTSRNEILELKAKFKERMQVLCIKVDTQLEEFRLSAYRDLETQGTNANKEISELKRKIENIEHRPSSVTYCSDAEVINQLESLHNAANKLGADLAIRQEQINKTYGLEERFHGAIDELKSQIAAQILHNEQLHLQELTAINFKVADNYERSAVKLLNVSSIINNMAN